MLSKHRAFAISATFALSVTACGNEWVTLGRVQTASGGQTGVSTIPESGGSRTSGGTTGTFTIPTNGGTTGTFTIPTNGGTTGEPIASTQGGTSASTGGATGAAGSVAFEEPLFSEVQRVPSLASSYEDDNPTLTSDLLELYFSSKNRPGGKGNVDVWVAKRSNPDGDFDAPTPVLEVSTAGIDSSPAIEADGLTLWVGFEPESGGLGGYDIMQSTRASRNDVFDEPVLVSALSSNKDDIPRPLGNHFSTMPLASRRDSDIYLTYLATRSSEDSTFDEPLLRPELISQGKNVADGFLSNDGLTIYFSRSMDDTGDLFVAHRTATDAAFGDGIALSTINTPYDDRDPWLSPDGTRLYFSSDRDTPGTLNIYQARLVSK